MNSFLSQKFSPHLLSNLHRDFLDVWEGRVQPEKKIMNFWVYTKNCLICARENIATCQPRDPPQTPYLRELPPRRGTRRQRCDECLGQTENELKDKCEINWGTCCSKEGMGYVHLLQWQQDWHQGRCKHCYPGLACMSATSQQLSINSPNIWTNASSCF